VAEVAEPRHRARVHVGSARELRLDRERRPPAHRARGVHALDQRLLGRAGGSQRERACRNNAERRHCCPAAPHHSL